MAIQSLQEEMVEYFNRLSIAQQRSIVQLVKTFAESRTDDFEPQTQEGYSKELEQSRCRN